MWEMMPSTTYHNASRPDLVDPGDVAFNMTKQREHIITFPQDAPPNTHPSVPQQQEWLLPDDDIYASPPVQAHLAPPSSHPRYTPSSIHPHHPSQSTHPHYVSQSVQPAAPHYPAETMDDLIELSSGIEGIRTLGRRIAIQAALGVWSYIAKHKDRILSAVKNRFFPYETEMREQAQLIHFLEQSSQNIMRAREIDGIGEESEIMVTAKFLEQVHHRFGEETANKVEQLVKQKAATHGSSYSNILQ